MQQRPISSILLCFVAYTKLRIPRTDRSLGAGEGGLGSRESWGGAITPPSQPLSYKSESSAAKHIFLVCLSIQNHSQKLMTASRDREGVVCMS